MIHSRFCVVLLLWIKSTDGGPFPNANARLHYYHISSPLIWEQLATLGLYLTHKDGRNPKEGESGDNPITYQH